VTLREVPLAAPDHFMQRRQYLKKCPGCDFRPRRWPPLPVDEGAGSRPSASRTICIAARDTRRSQHALIASGVVRPALRQWRAGARLCAQWLRPYPEILVDVRPDVIVAQRARACLRAVPLEPPGANPRAPVPRGHDGPAGLSVEARAIANPELAAPRDMRIMTPMLYRNAVGFPRGVPRSTGTGLALEARQ
jgi:hypothetical protein